MRACCIRGLNNESGAKARLPDGNRHRNPLIVTGPSHVKLTGHRRLQ